MTHLRLISPLLWMVFTIACESEEPVSQENPKNIVINTPKHAKPAPEDFQKKSFMCCDSEFGNQILAQYLAITQAMAADDDGKTKTAIANFHQFVNTPEFTAFAQTETAFSEFPKASQLWITLDRTGIQQDFADVSATMVDYAKAHKSESGTTVIGAFCPMAPGKWLQVETELRNPYYGSKMLTCGVFE